MVYLIRLYEQDEYVQQEICVLCAGMQSAGFPPKRSALRRYGKERCAFGESQRMGSTLAFTQPEKGVSCMTPEEQLGNNPITHLFILAG